MSHGTGPNEHTAGWGQKRGFEILIRRCPRSTHLKYQLAAQKMRPGDFVAMAAYGDYGPGYIGTEIAYGQGGYETGRVSRVAPKVESVLMNAMEQLLDARQ